MKPSQTFQKQSPKLQVVVGGDWEDGGHLDLTLLVISTSILKYVDV
jgi:hypothetical protein